MTAVSDPDMDFDGRRSESIDIGKDGLGITTQYATVGEGARASIVSIPAGGSDHRGSASSRHLLSPKTPVIHSTVDRPSPAFSQQDTAQNTPEQLMDRSKTVTWDVSDDERPTSRLSHRDPRFDSPYGDSQEYLNKPASVLNADFDCPTEKALVEKRWSWLAISVLTLAIYSSIFSAIFLGIALAKPRYGKKIGTQGYMSFSTASLLSALFSKTIELSFVTVFVSFLGQVLSRRALQTKARVGGITIAEMSMRTWIMQPGTMITHWEGVRFAALTYLGVASLTAALVATFYTTAAEALVSPKLRLGPVKAGIFQGKVAASWANPLYLSQQCQTPISNTMDPGVYGSTCLQIEHAGQAYHNYMNYLASWAFNIHNGNVSSSEYESRPPPIGVLYDNTTVQGQWIRPSKENVTLDSEKHGRFVQNLTMAMPHTGVIAAAIDPNNDILQPRRLAGTGGDITLKAGLPAGAVNVLCAGASKDEIAPLVYSEYPNAPPLNVSTWSLVLSSGSGLPHPPDYPNSTVLDELFLWDKAQGSARQRAPIFAKLPIDYNTLVNGSGDWPKNAIYILAKPPAAQGAQDYLVCGIRAMQYPNCTSRYHATKWSAQLSVHCDSDPDNTSPYSHSHPEARSGLWEGDWMNIGSEWANSLSLGAGITDGAASNARLLTQLIPPYSNSTPNTTTLQATLPSIGEALGVLAGCTLLLSSRDAPFIHYWNYSKLGGDFTMLQVPQYQSFNGSLQFQDFASGGTQQWQGIFYVVLVAVFVTNVFCTAYLFWSFGGEGQITDYTEPQNLFALAVNSPPSYSLSGACGAGPEGNMLRKKWEVDMTQVEGRAHPHFYMKCREDERSGAYRRIAERRRQQIGRTHSMEDFDVQESPAVGQYLKLTSRKTFL